MERVAEQWRILGQEALRASGVCLREKHYRAAVNRAYYAMFSATMAALLSSGETPRPDLGTWAHQTLAELVRGNLRRSIGHGKARDVRSRLSATYKKRLDADYVPGRTVDPITARRAVSDAEGVLKTLENLG